MIKKIISVILTAALILQILTITAFAADVTLTISKQTGYAGDSITISGTYSPDEWITVKAIDSDGNLIFIEPVLSGNDGTYSLDFIVPDIEPGTLTMVAGAGSDVTNETFEVMQRKHSHDDEGRKAEEKEKVEVEDVTIGDEEGNTINGTLEETDNSYNITIDGDDFSKVMDGSVKIATKFVEVTFDEMAAEYISDIAGSDSILLNIVNADVSKLSDEAQKLIGNRPAYEFTLNVGGTDISSFGGGLAYVSIPYTPSVDEDVNRIVIYYIKDDGERIVMTDSSYDGTSINAKFSTGHFSMYAVGYNEVTFDDVTKNDWYYDAVTFCAAREITTGTGNNLFSPDVTLTRGQFIVMLMRAYNIEVDENITDNFNDAGDTYYTNYLAAAKSLGITSGIGNNLFAPEKDITRQDMFVLLYRVLDVLGELPETDDKVSLSKFSDTDDISDYAQTAIKTFVSNSIISGGDGMLDPIGNSTRSQMAQVLYNLLYS